MKFLVGAATLAAAGAARADGGGIDITAATAGISDASTAATTLGGAALGLAVIFMGYKLVKRAIAKV